MYEISYLGKTYKTNIRKELTDKEYENIVKEYYAKPQFDIVQKQMKKISEGGVKINYIYNYYIKDIASKTKLWHSKWSIEEILKCKQLVEVFYGKTENNKKIYPDDMSITDKISTAFRLCGKGLAEKPANFPIKTADEVITQYNVNNKMFDYSCGWGVRLLSALRNNVNYYGTDPNYLLCDRLNQLVDDYKKTCNNNTKVDIRKHGSEIFVPEWENTFGLAFSSPPYFNLEDYKIGEQSYHDGMTYEEWINKYMVTTINNIYKYLIKNGYFVINIKNFKNYNLIQDVENICKNVGFELHDKMLLKNNLRTGISNHHNNEDIFIYKRCSVN